MNPQIVASCPTTGYVLLHDWSCFTPSAVCFTSKADVCKFLLYASHLKKYNLFITQYKYIVHGKNIYNDSIYLIVNCHSKY